MAYLSDYGPPADIPVCPDFTDDIDWSLAKDCIPANIDSGDYSYSQWKKPVLNECPALDKTKIWLDNAETKQGCEKWTDIGIALHYFMDAKEFWNNVIRVNTTCVNDHEDEINDYVVLGNGKFRSCSCGICYEGSDFDSWLLEFTGRIKPLISARHSTEPTVHIVHNELDGDAARELADWLYSFNVTPVSSSASSFAKDKINEFIVIIGGHMAPGVGPIADSVLTEGDKDNIINSVFSGASIKKQDVWVKGQTVLFIAGHGVAETAQAVSGLRSDILDMALDAHGSNIKTTECKLNDDCGSTYWGPWVCSNRIRASRVRYSPYCEFGECKLRAERPTSRGCMNGKYCVPMVGCVSDDELIEFKSYEQPVFKSWISHRRETALVGRNITYSIYIEHPSNDSTANLTCQHYTTSGDWEDIGSNWSKAQEIRYRFQGNNTGRHILTHRIRCGNVTSGDEVLTFYGEEFNFTAVIVPPAFAFTFWLDPPMLTLDDCFDTENVTLKIENLAGRLITCNYSIAQYNGYLEMNSSSQTYNITGGYWSWGHTNETYNVLSYYSGADFGENADNGTNYTKKDVEGNITVYDYSDIIPMYQNETKNITIFTPYFEWISTNKSYEWSYSPWSYMDFEIGSGQCAVYKHLVSVRCTDDYGQVTTLKKDLLLNLTNRDMSHLYD